MNRLILVGNGFDLAHGMKTSYNDFILWYLKDRFSRAFQEYYYEDTLMEITRSRATPSKWQTLESVNESIQQCYEEGRFEELVANTWFIPPANVIGHTNPIMVNVKSMLLKSLLNNCSLNRWVDIENEFYRHLKVFLSTNPPDNDNRLAELNHSLGYLIKLLEDYLVNLGLPTCKADYGSIIASKIKPFDVHNASHLLFEEHPKHTLILNFNYTNTIVRYLNGFPTTDGLHIPSIIYIHGQLSTNSNPLIFGFGDELDENYLKMQDSKIKGVFEYIKSFWYFKTSNYRKLLNFIDSDDYQIFILGHSCGLSDRTMLHMLFEHANCKSIKIYYHENEDGTNNFTELTHEIARHFKDKTEMRNKIVSFDRSSPMPQA